jgi:hypothetical protein
MLISCTCGNTESISNKMENFEVHLIKFTLTAKQEEYL